jgi:hypothetical protein
MRIILALLIVVFGGCKSVSIKHPALVHLKVDTASDDVYEVDSIVSHIQFIPLQTLSDNVVGKVDKITFLKDKIVILDRNVSKAIFLFKKDGTMIKEIKTLHGEHISDFIISGDKIIALLDFDNKLQSYDEAGNLLSTTDLGTKFYSSSFESLTPDGYLFFNNNIPTTFGNYKLIAFNAVEKEWMGGFLTFPKELSVKATPGSDHPLFRTHDGTVLVNQTFGDTIYALKYIGEHVDSYPAYVMDFSVNPAPAGFVFDPGVDHKFERADNKGYSYLEGFMDLKDYCFATYKCQGILRNFIWNKSGSHKTANSSGLFFAGEDIGLPVKMQQIDENTAGGYYPSFELVDWAKKHEQLKGKSNLYTIASTLTEENNPVLILLNFK